MSKRSDAGLIAGALLVIVLVLGYLTTNWWTHGTERVTVTGTTVKVYGHHSKYLVFTSDGVFENTDTWSYLKFDSSDIQGQLMQGGTFDISYYGFRVPFFSKYPNITYVQRVK
jgi:exopolysaccharide biosynthesis protein